MALPKVLANFTTSLASKITSSATSMTLSRSTDPDGTTLAGQYIVTVDEGTSVEEHMLVTLAGATATIDTRGLSRVDMSTSVSGNKFAHDRGAEVKITNAVLVRVINELNGVTSTSAMVGTTGTAWRIGNGTDQDAFVYAQNADAAKPFVKYDKTLNKWLISNDGTTTYDISAGGSGLSAGSGVTISASTINAKLNASGLLSASLGSGSDELGLVTDISAALAGTSGTPSAGNKFVTASDVSVTATASKIVRSGTDGTISNWISGVSGFGSTFVPNLTAGEGFSVGQTMRTAIANNSLDLRNYLSQTSSNTGYTITNTDSRIAQSFTTGSLQETIKQFTVALQKTTVSSTATTWTFRLNNDNSGQPGTEILNSTFNITLTGNGTVDIATITLDVGQFLAASTLYWISLEWDSGGTPADLNVRYSNANPYSGGNMATSSNAGVSWTPDTNSDMYFTVLATDTPGRVYKGSSATTPLSVATFGLAHAAYATNVAVAQADVTGVFVGLTGLTTGSQYFVSHVRGGLSGTAAVVSKKVGLALSSSTMLLNIGL